MAAEPRARLGLCAIIVQVFLIKPIVAAVGDRGALLGLAFGAVGFVIYGVAPLCLPAALISCDRE